MNKNYYLSKMFNNHEISPFDKMVKEFFNMDNQQLYKKNSIGSVNVIDNEKDYQIEINVPGYNKDEIEINVEDGYININGEHKIEEEKEGKNYTRREFSKTSFNRSFILPEDINDEFKAKLQDGVLTIIMDKKLLKEKNDSKKIFIE